MILDGDIVIFNKIEKNGRLSAINCQRLVDALSNNDLELQEKLLHDYLLSVSDFNTSNYQMLKSIGKIEELDKNIKYTFLNSAIEKANALIQFEILFVDNLIDIQNKSFKYQTDEDCKRSYRSTILRPC